MERLVEFAGNHWELFLALAVTLGLIIYSFISQRLAGYQSVGPLEATRLINHEAAAVLDVREAPEYREGHIAGAIHIPLSALKTRHTELGKLKERPILVYCRSGSRSGTACSLLRKQGFAQIYSLGGGLLAWLNANLPVTKR